jgi:hypothetical protein|tara:strand:- start:513 stop:764 length:252 start_codon:yes stop_codon:yes gene_type:complete
MKSLRKAIDSMCKSCIYDDQVIGTWRQQVAVCCLNECPLHPVRPVGDHNNSTYLTKEIVLATGNTIEELDNRARNILKYAPEG